MSTISNHTQQQVRAIIFHSAAQDLLVNRDSRGSLDMAQSVNGRADAQLADTLDVEASGILLTSGTLLTVLDGHLGESDTDGTDIATEHITAIQSLPSSNSVIQTLKIDWKT